MLSNARAALVLGTLLSSIIAACGDSDGDDPVAQTGGSAGTAGSKGGSSGSAGKGNGGSGGSSAQTGGGAGEPSSGGASGSGGSAEGGASNGGADGVGSWNDPDPIDEAGDADQLDLAIAADGHACAVWGQSDGSYTDIWGAAYDPVEGWTAAEKLDTNDTADAEFPKVAIAPSGSCFAVWQERTLDVRGLWYNPGSGWESPTPFEVGAALSSSPDVGIDDSGNVMVIWVQKADDQETTPSNLWGSRYATGAWGTSGAIESAATGYPEQLRLAVGADGYAVAAWIYNDPGSAALDTTAIRYVPGSGWETQPTTLENDAAATIRPAAAIAPGGDALVVWEQADTVWFNRYGNDWGTATKLVDGAVANGPDVVMDAMGNAIVAWSQEDAGASPPLSVWATRVAANGTVEEATLLEDATGTAGGAVKLAIDSDGSAMALFRQDYMGSDNLFSNHYDPGAGWYGAQLIPGSSEVDLYAVGLADSGTAIALFDRWDGVRYPVLAAVGSGW